MECKSCQETMYERKARGAVQATVVYICPRCGETVFVWPGEEDDEEG